MEHDFLSILTADLERLSEFGEETAVKTEKLIEGEHREVAILFLDIKGFTSIAEKLNAEAVHKLMLSIMGILKAVVESHSGYVDKIEGDLIMGLFGAKQATENDCIRAVLCGLKLLDRVAEINVKLTKENIPIGCRIGINYGWVTVAPDVNGHLTAMGDCVNVASRMESTAEPNTIQVTENVVKATGEFFIWQDLGLTSIKGKERPIHTFRPTGPGATQLARWERTRFVARSPLIGREHELDTLRKLWERQNYQNELNPRGFPKHCFVGIRGEAGIGKSRLIHDFLKGIKSVSNQECILCGQTRSVSQPPYQLWITLLKNYLHLSEGKDKSECFEQTVAQISSSNEKISQTLHHDIPFLRSLLSLPVQAGELEKVSDKDKREETIIALRNLIQAIAIVHHRLVLVLEDVHWLDVNSQEALEYVINNTDLEIPLFVICLYRPDKEDGQPLLLRLKESYVNFHELHLPPLDREQSTNLINAILENNEPKKMRIQFPERFYQSFLNYAQGNPYYIEELLLDSIESGRLYHSNNGWSVQDDSDTFIIPSSITGLVRARIDRLPNEERNILQQCSVLGYEFSLLLYRIYKARISPDSYLELHLNNLVFKDFLNSTASLRDLSYKFKLTTTKNVAYEMLLQHNKEVLHMYTAEALEEVFHDELDPVSDLIAHHWELANNDDKAIRHGIRALTFLKKSYAMETALNLANRLQGLLLKTKDQSIEKTHQLYEIYRISEVACDTLGRRKEQREVLDRILILCQQQQWVEELIDVKLSYGRYYIATGKFDEAEKEYCEVKALAEGRSDDYQKAVALGNFGIIMNRKGLKNEAIQQLETAIEMLTKANETQHIANFLTNIAGIYFEVGRIDDSLLRVKQALELARANKSRRTECTILFNMVNFSIRNERFDEAIGLLSESLVLARELGDRKTEGSIYGMMGFVYNRLSEFGKSFDYYTRALSIHREVGNIAEEEMTLFDIIEFLENQNRNAETIPYWLQMTNLNRQTGNNDALIDSYKSLVEALMREGNVVEADIFRKKIDEIAAGA